MTTIILTRRANCWTARFRGFIKGLPCPAGELALPFAANASQDLVWFEMGKRFPEAKLFAVIQCEGCGQ